MTSKEITAAAKQLIKAAKGDPITVADIGIALDLVETKNLATTLARHSGEPGSLIEKVEHRAATYRWRGPIRNEVVAMHRPVVVEVPKESTPSPIELLISQTLCMQCVGALRDKMVKYPEKYKELDEFHKDFLRSVGIKPATNTFDTKTIFRDILTREARII